MATVMKDKNLYCTICKEEKQVNYPIKVNEWIKIANEFIFKHKNCKKNGKRKII